MNTFVIASGVDRQSNAIKQASSDAKVAELDATQPGKIPTSEY